MAFEDDDLGDLAAVMGDDYGHGFDDSSGDPNVKPVKAPAPKKAKNSTQTAIFVKFPAQKQFLTKLVIEAVGKSHVVDPANPFKGLSREKRIVQPKEPQAATTADLEKLQPAELYFIRLVCTNPSGTSYGQISQFWTLPPAPPAPDLGYATAKAVSIKFPAQGPNICKLSIEMSVWCADPFGPENKKKGMLTDSSNLVGQRTTGLVKNLKPGTAYVFRLHVSTPAGTVVGGVSKPVKTLPPAPEEPREEATARTDKTIKLKWKPFGHEITKLSIQYAILNGKSTFQDLKKNGGREITLSNPQEISEYTVKNLKPETNYVFRLVAANTSGKSFGKTAGPIKTVTYSPDQNDKSGWMYLLNGGGKSKRRASLRSKLPKHWFTLESKLLTWFSDVNGEELGYLHLGRVVKIEVNKDMITAHLRGAKRTVLSLRAFCDNPSSSPEAMAKEWAKAIDAALRGGPPPEEKAAVAAAIAPAEDEELDDEGDGFEEEEGFGEGFSEDEEDEGGFGGFGEDEEEAGGFGGADEDEEEATGFD